MSGSTSFVLRSRTLEKKGYDDLARPSRHVSRFLWACLIFAPYVFWQDSLRDGWDSLLGRILGWPRLLLYPLAGFAFLRWTWLASWNASALSDSPLRYSPGWAVGWYFIPILCFWKPFQAVTEIFKASQPDSPQEPEVPAVVQVWWMIWILSFPVSAIPAEAGLVWGFIELALELALYAATIQMVNSLRSLQTEKHRILCDVGTARSV